MALRVESVNLDAVTPADYNPRKISDHAMNGLEESIKRFGLVQPIVVNTKTGRIVGGHQRVEALRRSGETQALAVCGEWTEQEERQLNLTLNNPLVQGEWHGLDDALEALEITDALAALNIDGLMPENFGPVDIDQQGIVGEDKPKAVVCPSCGHEFTT